MKYIIVVTLFWVFQLKADEYVVPSDVIGARDSAIKSMNKFRDTLINRYFELSQKKYFLSKKKMN